MTLTMASMRVGKLCWMNLERISLQSDTKPDSGAPARLCSLSRLACNTHTHTHTFTLVKK